jgi:hypothetical protein
MYTLKLVCYEKLKVKSEGTRLYKCGVSIMLLIHSNSNGLKHIPHSQRTFNNLQIFTDPSIYLCRHCFCQSY